MHDIPPKENGPPPLDVREFCKELSRIGGATDSGYPHLRLVWGQEREGPLASLYEMAGELHLKHRHHVKKTPLFALPVYGLEDKIVDYEIYESADVIPIDGRVIGRLTMREDIGIPRWFIEQAWAIDPLEWEYQRQMAVHRKEPDPGPCPDGALNYEAMYPLAMHNNCCDAESKDAWGRECFGVYRAPSEMDLQVLRFIEAEMRQTEGWTGNEGWRNPAVGRKVAQAVIAHRAEDARQARKDELESRALMASQLRPHAKRASLLLTGTGSGMDLEKYHTVPAAYKKIKRGKHATAKTSV